MHCCPLSEKPSNRLNALKTSCPQLKEQASDSISVLEGALQLKKDFYIHTLRTLDLLGADAAANGETESSTAGLRISADELHCQVSGQHRSDQIVRLQNISNRFLLVKLCILDLD